MKQTRFAPPGTKLAMKHLPEDATAEVVKALFEAHGTVTGIDIRRRGDGSCRGFGFVSFASAEEATAAIGALNGTKLGGNELSVYLAVTREKVKSEEPKDSGKGDRRSQR